MAVLAPGPGNVIIYQPFYNELSPMFITVHWTWQMRNSPCNDSFCDCMLMAYIAHPVLALRMSVHGGITY